MKVIPGNYVGRIEEHGTDTSKSGLPLVWVRVNLIARLNDEGQSEPVHVEEPAMCRVFLAGGDEEKTATAVRMARQALRLCGFDPDQREIADIDDAPTLLRGNEVPVRVSEREFQGRFYTNYDIALPRGGVGKSKSAALTSALRAAKAQDEPAMPPARTVKDSPPPKPGTFPQSTVDAAKASGVDIDDIPF